MLKKIIVTSFAIILFVLILFIITVYNIESFVDIDKYKNIYLEKIEKETGFKVTCEKAEFKKEFKPYIKVHLHHTGVMYPNNTKFLQIKDADLKIKLLPLFFKKIEIQNIQLNRPIINITLYKDFSTSIEKFVNDKFDMKGFSLIIPSIEAKNYKIKFQDNSINKTFHLEGEKLVLLFNNIWQPPTQPLPLEGGGQGGGDNPMSIARIINDIKFNKTAHIIINGSIFEDKKEYIKYNLDFITPLNDKQHFTFSPFKTIKENNVKGIVQGHLDKNLTGNIKIKDLSLNIGNITSRNNNIDLNFKGDEVEINSLIHTSNQDSAEVKGKIIFGKKRYINLNTNAKNINLENLFKIISSISKILNIKNPLNDTSAKGILNADFNIKSDFKTLDSKGKAEIINGSFNNSLIPYPISNVNANIDFNNNEIKIIKALGFINKTPLNLEGIIKSDLSCELKAYSNGLDLKTVILFFSKVKNLPFDIKKGDFNFKTEVKGKLPDKLQGNIKLENICFEYNKKPIKISEFNFDFDNNGINIAKNKILFLNSPIFVEGKVKNFNNPEGKIKFEGNILPKDIAIFLSEYINQPYKALGNIKTIGNIEFNSEKCNLKAKINADKDNYLSYIVVKELLNKPSSLNIDIELDKNYITIKKGDIEINDEPKIKIAGKIKNLKEPEFENFNFSIPNKISVASNFFGGEEISFKSDLTFNKSIKSPEINGNAKILSYKIKKYLMQINNADINLNSNNIRIVAPDIIVNDSVFNVTMDVIPDLKELIVSNMQLNSMNIDVNSLFEIIKELKQEKRKITVKKGSAIINNCKIADLKAKDITSDFKIDNNILKITNIKAASYRGNVKGKADYEIGSGILNINMEGKNLDIKTSMHDLTGFDDNLFGQVDIKANISMLTGNKNSVLKTLSGSMEFNAKNGAMGTLGKFEYYLYARNILYHGILNTTINRLVQVVSHDDTTQFRFSQGRVLFQNGYIISDGIYTSGNNMSLYVKGRHNMFTNQSNLDIYGRISDEISQKLGSFADVSISEVINGSQSQKNNYVLLVSNSIINEIPKLSNNQKSNTFKVNVLGDIKALNAINSFNWILSNGKKEEIKEEEQNLPDFSDL